MSVNGLAKRNAKLLQGIKGHSSDVTSCDFAPNFTLVTGSSDKTVRVWDWTKGAGYVERHNSPLSAHKYQVTCVRVSPQGSMLATASVDGTALLWCLHSLSKLYTMTQVNGDAIRVCRFSPDSALLVTAGDNGAVCIWDLIHRSLIRTLFEHEGTTQGLSFTPDSQFLITACSLEVIKVWHVQDLIDTTVDNCLPITRMDNVHDMGIFSIDVSKYITVEEDNPFIRHYTMATCGCSDEIKLWKITTKSLHKHKNPSSVEVSIDPFDVLDGHNSSVTCIRYSNVGSYLISCSLDKSVKVWDTNGACVSTLYGHQRYVNCVAISRDSSIIASGSNDKSVIVWDLNGDLSMESELFTPIAVHTHGVVETHLVENSDSESSEVKVVEKIDDIFDAGVNSCCFHGNLLATGSGDKMVRIFKVVEENNNIEELSCSPLEGHTYAVNYVEFSKDGSKLASSSLDGCTLIWDPLTGEKFYSVPKNSQSVKVCRFSPNTEFLVTAGDDERAIVWDVETLEKQAVLEGHLDTVTSACISPDNQTLVTVSCNADFRVWQIDQSKCIYVKEDAHDYGIQSCDFSENLEPIPNITSDSQSYLLGTCGNDSLVKLWRLTVPKTVQVLDFENLEIKIWHSLQGHGGNVISVRFSPSVGEIVCSTATDRQARIWSVYGGQCLHVLDHDSIVTCCSFSADCSLLATGCLDKTLWIWKLPQQLVFQTTVANKIRCHAKTVAEWSNGDVIKWLDEIDMSEIAESVRNTSLNGEKILTLSEERICSGLELDDEKTEKLATELKWLKKVELQIVNPLDLQIPDEFLCPITHEIMREPVVCSDGFTYEKKAIAEWFMSGKFTSPMTNEILARTDFTPNLIVRDSIRRFLENVEEDQD
ncbi:WD repeat, SAM and U-box domain-containing protein 1-like isoform X2 [Cylas formicarius]|uniref:WD repeat, SAM and U-box domain-containing protein 1-like isoform X2 n=1 Tax=Cylas formicarius TaxID=197179 RepID=UPI00295852C7|nr:WD repeat, SAM and U-box domain-containing protein 1-like isoform X2 [Cylas formicarius]